METKNYTPLPLKLNLDSNQREQANVQLTVEHKQIDQEISPHVQVREEIVEIPPTLQEMGVQAIPTAYFETKQEVKALLPEAEIAEGLKQPTDSSFRWLAELARYLDLKKN